jgi:hypothetical protein
LKEIIEKKNMKKKEKEGARRKQEVRRVNEGTGKEGFRKCCCFSLLG